MKRQPKGRVDPLEEFRFTPVTKRTRRARRLKANSKRNWAGQWDSTKLNYICKSAVVLKENHPKDATSVKRQNNERVKDVLFLYFHENWVFPNSRIPLGWCHRANVSVMLFILDKLKDLRKNSCRLRRHPRLNCSGEGVLFFLTMGLKRELTQCYKNQPTRDLLEYLSVFVCVSLHDTGSNTFHWTQTPWR